MKILLILSITIILSAFDNVTAAKIFNKIFLDMLQKQEINVYTNDKVYLDVIEKAENLSVSNSCETADIVLITQADTVSNTCKEKPAFATSKKAFKTFDDAVGSFYWDRGHIKIKFSKNRLEKFNIRLSSSYDKYYIKEES